MRINHYTTPWSFRLAVYSTLVVLNLILLVLFHQAWPRVGFDLSTFLARLVDVYLHYRCNGWSVQWWTPSFGGGLPAFSNPEHTQFMLAQFLLPLTDPWRAVVLNSLLPLSLGFLLIVKFCHDYLRWSAGPALAAATIFATNDFALNHAFAGHISYANFQLVTLLPFGLHDRLPMKLRIALLAGAAATITVTGGYTTIFVFTLTALLLATGLACYDAKAFPLRRSMVALVGGAGLAALAVAAKVCAVACYLQQFPREASYVHSAPTLVGAWLSLPAQFFLLPPLLLAQRWVPFDAHGVFQQLAGVNVEDLGFSLIAGGLIVVGTMAWWRRGTGSARSWLFVALAVWITVEFTLGRGLVWPLLKPLPFLRSLHMNSRFGAAFILPCVLLAGLGLHVAIVRLRKSSAFALASLAVIISLGTLLTTYRRQMHSFWFANFDATRIQQVWATAKTGESFQPIRMIADLREDEVFTARASNLKPYEPIFGYGYGGAAFKTQLQPGPIFSAATDQRPNFNFPLAFHAPFEAKQDPFTPIPAQRANELRVLLSRRQPDWPLPPIQRLANWLSVFGWLVIVGGGTAMLIAHKRQPLTTVAAPPPTSG